MARTDAPRRAGVVLAAFVAVAALASSGAGLEVFPPAIAPTKLLPATPSTYGWFGYNVEVDGPTMAVGALGGFGLGVVQVYRRDSDDTWQPEVELHAPQEDQGGKFWGAIAIDGDRMALGAEVPGDRRMDGAVHLYERIGGVWTYATTVAPPGTDRNDDFGWSAGLDGDTLAVGALREVRGGVRGAVLVYRLTGPSWVPEARLAGADLGAWDDFSYRLALSGDTLLAGASRQAGYTGAAYLFERSGTTWTQVAKLKPEGLSEHASFGLDLDLKGGVAVVASPYERHDHDTNMGAVYVFERGPAGWAQAARLEPFPNMQTDDYAQSVSFDGHTIAVGTTALYDSQSIVGAAYLYAPTPQGWVHSGLQVTPPFDAAPRVVLGGSDYYGFEVEVDGDTLAVGAPLDDQAAHDAGAVYAYRGLALPG